MIRDNVSDYKGKVLCRLIHLRNNLDFSGNSRVIRIASQKDEMNEERIEWNRPDEHLGRKHRVYISQQRKGVIERGRSILTYPPPTRSR